MKNFLKDSKRVHFIGIGGIGISAIARMLILEGKKVSGSDMSDSENISELKKTGAKIFIGHDSKNISKDIDLVIYTIAITPENPEFKQVVKLGIKMITYPQALHEISKDKFTIAVSGTHGKTTTTAMIAKIMMDAGLDPTVIVGSMLKDTKTNFIAGKSKYLVVESCEYRKSFLNIEPTVAIVTNIDNDHLDFYKDLADIQSAFTEFVNKVPKSGYIICNPRDKIVSPILSDIKAKVISSEEFFDRELKMKVPGDHNKKNASMALAVAHILQIDKHKALKSVEGFSGTWRRFEHKGETKDGVIVYDDYAHHPTEIKATLKGAREFFNNKKIIVVFQPHLFSRTKLLLNDFAKSFNDADEVLLAPIYPAREVFDPTISSEILSGKIKNKKVISFKSFEDIEKYIKENLKKGDVLITVGAGDVYKIGEGLVSSI
ncbi:MAG: UDP-N-acetylmuramate--L-alanine ligase [Candidatus Paceibacterota bacterium]|jgi:UDP-N-acetylmuramate--alanine ligase